MTTKYLFFGLIFSLIICACSTEAEEKKQKSVEEYKYQITMGIDPSGMALSKNKGTLKEELDQLKGLYEKRLKKFGMEDFAVEIIKEKHELVIGLDKKVNQATLFQMLSANAVVKFYETYKALEVLNEFYTDDLPTYLLQFKDQLISDEGMERDTSELIGELAEAYFPAFPSVSHIDMETSNNPYFLVALGQDTTRVSKVMNDPIIKEGMSDMHDLKMMWGMTTIPDNRGNKTTYYPLYCLKQPFDEEHQLSAKHIISAEYLKDDETGGHIIAVEFNAKGTKIFEELTSQNLDKYLAISVQNMVISAPKIIHTISEGKMHISGSFSKDEAKFIAYALSIGELPFKIVIKGHNFDE